MLPRLRVWAAKIVKSLSWTAIGQPWIRFRHRGIRSNTRRDPALEPVANRSVLTYLPW
ncbi:hypothetical protein BC826DRAFT_1023766 [Russula brevipes]|nr:hypothetical protein BC826DRAFT_1023766 [Russula brevipes]